MVKLQNALLFLPVFLLISSVSKANPCSDEFRKFVAQIPAHIEHKTTLEKFPGHEVDFLGEGFGGGKVYLVKPPGGGEKFVIKDYVFSGRYSTTNDAIGLGILEQVTSGNTSAKQIRPVKVLDRVDETTLKLEYAPGTDVHRLAIDAKPGEHKKLARLFRRQLESLQRNLKNKNPIEFNGVTYDIFDSEIRYSAKTAGLNDLVVTLKPRGQMSSVAPIELWIKPENVVMTSDGRILIIDPR